MLDSNLKIACICDEFTYQCFKYDLNLFQLSKQKWYEELSDNRFDLLLVESAWEGKDNNWRGLHANTVTVSKIVDFFKTKNIPTIFYNKEDPVHYNLFLPLAKLFDIIITSDENCIEQYKQDCQHDRIYIMSFCAQPKIHNPINRKENDDCEIIFAGSWPTHQKERCKKMPILLNPATNYKFTIYDRFSNLRDNRKFPNVYKKFIKSKVEYEDLINLYKRYKIFLNFNSVSNSSSMFSRRIFEILASKGVVVSTESTGIKQMFPGIVSIVESEEEAKEVFNKLLSDDEYRYKLGHLGYREVMTKHTLKDRLHEFFPKIGINYPNNLKKISITVITNNPLNIQNIKRNLINQNYSNIEATIILNNDDYNLKKIKLFFNKFNWINIIQVSEKITFTDCLNIGINLVVGDYWTKMDENDIYYKNYISDMLLTFKYVDADIIGKGSYFVHFNDINKLFFKPKFENCYSNEITSNTLLVKKEVLSKNKFLSLNDEVNTFFLNNCINQGFKIYSCDKYNYLSNKNSNYDINDFKNKDFINVDIKKSYINI